MKSTKPTLEISEPEFKAEVLQSEQPVLVNFWAEWSQPCRYVRLPVFRLCTENLPDPDAESRGACDRIDGGQYCPS